MPKSPFSWETNFPFRRGGEKKKINVRGTHGNWICFIELKNKADSVRTALPWLGGGESHVNFIFRSTRGWALNKDENLISVQKEFKPCCILCFFTERIWSFLSQDQQFSAWRVVGRGSVRLLQAGQYPPTGVRAGLCRVRAPLAHAGSVLVLVPQPAAGTGMEEVKG